MDMAGRDLTWYMARMLSEENDNRGRWFQTSAEWEIAKYIKEANGYVAYHPDTDESETIDDFAEEFKKFRDHDPSLHLQMFVMPDDQAIKIWTQQFRVAEPLFKPELVGVESAGLPTLIVDSVSMC